LHVAGECFSLDGFTERRSMSTPAIQKYVVRKDRILFPDNELTCWKEGPPPGERPEIIEIGVAELDVESLTITRAKSYLVRPQFSTVSPYCTELTGHTEAALRKNGHPLPEVYRRIEKDFGTGSKAYFAWGRDREALERDAALKGTVSPFSAAFVDLGMYFSMTMGLGRAVGLTEAMELHGLERSGRIHSGVDDAIDTARLWAEMARRSRAMLLTPVFEEDSDHEESILPKP
jgi:inhibitor of KinA sporulation pathway (predicted exonuclease)